MSEITPPTFLWRDPVKAAASWSIDVTFADGSPVLHAISAGERLQIGEIDEVPTDDPVGDPGLLSDLGIEAARLTRLGERTLPGDALSVIAERVGFAEDYDRLR